MKISNEQRLTSEYIDEEDDAERVKYAKVRLALMTLSSAISLSVLYGAWRVIHG